MKFSSWMGSPWFYVCLILALAIVIGLCVKKRKNVRKMGSCCGGCWTRCHEIHSDGVERDSPGSTSYWCVNPETLTSKQNIELRDISNPKKRRRRGKLTARKTIHSTGTISETLKQRLTRKKDDLESPWSKYYQPDPELARRFLEEKAAMSENQRKVGTFRERSSRHPRQTSIQWYPPWCTNNEIRWKLWKVYCVMCLNKNMWIHFWKNPTPMSTNKTKTTATVSTDVYVVL